MDPYQALYYGEIGCSACLMVHGSQDFTKEEKLRPSFVRRCRNAARELDACEHLHSDLSAITKMVEENAASDGFPETNRTLEFYCEHPSHAEGDLHPDDSQRPSCKVVFSASGEPPVISPGRAYCLGTGLLWPWTDDQTIAGRRRIRRLEISLCPHTTTAAPHVYKSFDYRLRRNVFYGEQLEGGGCQHSGCTMRFWFSRSSAYNAQHGVRCTGGEIAVLWLHVERCRFDFPVSANDEAWLACSQPAITAEDMRERT